MNAGAVDRVDRVGPRRRERDEPARSVPIGTRSSGVLAVVDGSGLVGPVGEGWSLDWWVGAEDRWHLPAREASVRQVLIDRSPVVETRLRVPGGDIVQRVHAVQGSAALDRREAILVELTNETPLPVAVALAIRPYTIEGDGSLQRIVTYDDRMIGIDDGWTLVADRPARKGAGAGDGTDPLAAVTSGRASATWEPVEDDRGRASLALIFPLPHSASLRAALVSGGPPSHADVDGGGSVLDGLPPADAVASGWAQQTDRGLRLDLPDESLTGAFTAARRRLVLGAPDLVDASIGTDQALIARALAELGHRDDLRPVVGGLLDRQGLTGAVPDSVGSEAATGAALALVGWWWRLDPRPELLGELVGPMAAAARSIERRRVGRRVGRRNRRDPKKAGLLPEGPQSVELGGATTAYLDDWWAAAGLIEASMLLTAGGQAEAAAEVESSARLLLEAVSASSVAAQPEPGEEAIPVGPDRSLDPGIVGLLPALAPLGVVGPADAGVARTIELIRSDLVDDDGWVQAGVAGPFASPRLTACLALFELGEGDRRALDRLDWLVRAGGPTTSWPGRGGELVDVALFVLLVRALVVRERHPVGARQPDGLDILSVMPPTWLGQSLEVHDVPTTFGRFGFALRWHGERPALLWELEPAPGAPPATITVPGLDPGWSTTEPVGETLLAAPAATAMMGDDADFG